jgi:AraC-like DNA-binding protein
MAEEGFKQFFIGNPLKNPYLVLNGVGYRELMPSGLVRRPEGLGDYLFMYFYGPVTVGSLKKHPVHEGGILMVWQPGSDHYYGNPEREYLHTWTHCEGVWIRKMIARARFPLDVPVVLSEPGVFEDFIKAVYREALRSDSDAVIVRNLFENLLRTVKRNTARKRAPCPDWLIEVREYMDRQYREKCTLAELASRVYKSVPHFCAEFKKHFGTPPIRYIINQRLNEALHLLHNINLSVTEIACSVGYGDVYQFSKAFRRRYGVPPLKMRKRFSASGGPT